VARDADGIAVALLVDESGFVVEGNFYPALVFQANDCTGQPLGAPQGGSTPQERPILPRAAVDPQRLRGYYQVGDLAVYNLGSEATFVPDASTCTQSGGAFVPPNLCCKIAPSQAFFAPLSTIDLTTYTPPFRVQAP
jgi:hypothetical protein